MTLVMMIDQNRSETKIKITVGRGGCLCLNRETYCKRKSLHFLIISELEDFGRGPVVEGGECHVMLDEPASNDLQALY